MNDAPKSYKDALAATTTKGLFFYPSPAERWLTNTALLSGETKTYQTAAVAVASEQTKQAFASMDLWRRGLKHENIREQRAKGQVEAAKAGAAWHKSAAAARRARRPHTHRHRL